MGYQSHKPITRKSIELALGRAAIVAIARIALALPDRFALRLGASIGSAAYCLSRRYRTVAIANLTDVFGREWDQRRIHRTARDVFRHIAMNLIEFLRFRGMDPNRLEQMVTVEGEEHLRKALEQGKGVLAFSAHYGNFEMFGAAMVRKGYALSVIARDADDDATNDLINGIRARMGYRVFSRDGAARRSISTLRRNEILGLLPDQNDANGIFVPFFGRLACTAPGAAYLALHTGAAIIPTFIHRGADMRHYVHIYPPIEYTPTGHRDSDIYNITLRINETIEREIREHPDQWFWLHNRWKTRPSDEAHAGMWAPSRHARSHQTRPDAAEG
ncbi:MAG TPA: lysophospholipid acyltransferase family protein [Armatimonadota bacterium]|jgi:KDO2-lipid IV(A) lauroyltransferase